MSCFRAFNFVSENRTRHTLCRSSGSLLGRRLSLDIGSARSISVPGLYLISRSYPCILSNILWSCGGGGGEGRYLHYSTYKNIFSIVDLPEAYKDKSKVDFYPENLHIDNIPHFIAKPRVQNCTPRNRPFCSTRSRLTYSLLRLSLSGDIHPNPGPAAASNNSPKCPICERAVAKTHRAIECDTCLRWCHIKCGRVSPSE